ncbi:MAG: nuclear transport factor 2 family protein [Pyrinomonadaceae bacterium]|jgi:hypothetical protein|nr:nuclear transport factor 2 family protein [Pyrinomonadaceae bacterium]
MLTSYRRDPKTSKESGTSGKKLIGADTFECEVLDDTSLAVNARDALERVCSGKGLDSPFRYYSQEFVDHVNDMRFQGLEGARRSVELYPKVLSDLDVVVEEQLTDGIV